MAAIEAGLDPAGGDPMQAQVCGRCICTNLLQNHDGGGKAVDQLGRHPAGEQRGVVFVKEGNFGGPERGEEGDPQAQRATANRREIDDASVPGLVTATHGRHPQVAAFDPPRQPEFDDRRRRSAIGPADPEEYVHCIIEVVDRKVEFEDPIALLTTADWDLQGGTLLRQCYIQCALDQV